MIVHPKEIGINQRCSRQNSIFKIVSCLFQEISINPIDLCCLKDEKLNIFFLIIKKKKLTIKWSTSFNFLFGFRANFNLTYLAFNTNINGSLISVLCWWCTRYWYVLFQLCDLWSAISCFLDGEKNVKNILKTYNLVSKIAFKRSYRWNII